MVSTRKLSLREKLPLLVSALTAAALVLAVALGYSEVRGTARAAAEARLHSLQLEIGDLIASSVVTRRQVEEEIARSPAVIAALRGLPPDSAALVADLHRLRNAVDGNLPVMLIAADDRVVWSMGEQNEFPDPDPDPPLDTARAFGYFRPAGLQLRYWSSIPVRSSGGPLLGWIAQRRGVGNPQTRDVLQSLIGSDITLSLGQPTDSVWVDFGGGRVEDAPSKLTFGEPFTFARRDGGQALAVAGLLADTPWVLLLQTPMSVVLARPRAFLGKTLLMGSLLIVLMMAVAWRLTRRLTGPLERLAVAADRVAAGSYGQRVIVDGHDELASLARSFNAMAEQVARSDEALRQRLDEASAIAVRLDRSRKEAESANEAKSKFLAMMSHEIRTPINAVLGYTELLEQGIPHPPSEDQREYLRRIARSSRLLISLVNDVLDFSRIESGRMRLDLGVGSTRDATLTAVAVLEPEATRKGITVTVRCEDLPFHGDQQRVEQILLNLLSNAVKFTGAGGSIAIACSRSPTAPRSVAAASEEWVRIEVTDSGVGIEPEMLQRIFEPFEQGKAGTNAPREHGVGLGLAISQRLAGMMSGVITVESRRGEGSHFTVWLPASDVHAPSLNGLPPSAARREADDPANRGTAGKNA